MPKILIIEDDQQLAASVQEWLQKEGSTVEVSATGEDGIQLLKTFGYDLIILDWDLPGISGQEVCSRFRAMGGQTAIMFLTGRSHIDDKQFGFNSGADDYLCKPFDLRELSLRCKALLRRQREPVVLQDSARKIFLRPEERTITLGKTSVSLTKLECAVLQFLMSNPTRSYSALELFKNVWPSDSDSSEDAVRVLIKSLRSKLRRTNEECATSVLPVLPGQGYIFSE